ncbi:MAG: energy-coupling factor ABC transporter ATP-binding protein [Candidatus Heimdallarchaeota archaeon]
MLVTEDLHYNYPDGTHALKGINLEICRGEAVAIMGPNGAGKTTLGKHFNGLFKPTTGEVHVEGQNTKNQPISELARTVGYVVQDPDSQLFEKTVTREVAFGLINLGYSPKEIDRRVGSILKKFELEDVAKRSPLSLSMGQKKRVTIASIVAMDTEYLVLDEPTTGQDIVNKERLKNLFKELITNSKTVILITHDIEFALSLAGRLILMKDGKIISDKPKNQTNLCSTFLKELRLSPPQMVQFSEGIQKKIWSDFPTQFYTIDEVHKEIQKRW